jgi:hypothetical protein
VSANRCIAHALALLAALVFVVAAAPGIALAHHVDYWDWLGRRDRFAKAQFT